MEYTNLADGASKTAFGLFGDFVFLFSAIPTENSKEIEIHAEKIYEEWGKRKIEFVDSEKIRLITVFFHDQLTEEENPLFIGHAGILLTDIQPTAPYFIFENGHLMEGYCPNPMDTSTP